jgi:pilin isopeptide linkage protein
MVSADNYSCTASIPVSVTVTGSNVPSDSKFTVTLSAADQQSVMPATTSFTATGNQTFNFGPMTFNTPGDYKYLVKEEKGSASNFTYDSSVYTVTVRVINDNKGGLIATVWAEKDGQTTKSDSVNFVNTYAAPTTSSCPTTSSKACKGTSTVTTVTTVTTVQNVTNVSTVKPVKTGDTSNVVLYMTALITSVIVALLIVMMKRHENNKYNK